MIKELQQKIMDYKKQHNVVILAHSYQAKEILEIADITGDSFILSQKACDITADTVIVCGVHFMAETVKILSPQKRVILANGDAGCPMAEQLTPADVLKYKQNSDMTVVSYINTTAALKTVSDVCVTSASAVKIVEKLDGDILFIPDINLGSYVQKQLPNKHIKLVDGGCPIHSAVVKDDALLAKKLHPNAMLLVHPECKPEVVELADFVGSTTAIMEYAINSDKTEFIIGTELSIAEFLQYKCSDKQFFALSKKLFCPDMRITTLSDVYNALIGNGGLEIKIDDKTIKEARVCIDKMIELGK